MNKTLKKALSLALVVCMLLSAVSMLASCGGNTNTDTPGGNTDTPGGNTDTPGGNTSYVPGIYEVVPRFVSPQCLASVRCVGRV